MLLELLWSILRGGVVKIDVAINYISIVHGIIVVINFIVRCMLEEAAQPRKASP
jgi:hypothetical protein